MSGILSVCRDGVQTMLDKVRGLKCLVLDEDTVGMISVVFSQSEILEREVYLVQRIDVEHSKSCAKHLKGVFFLRPSPANFLRLAKELINPRFGGYYLYFSNVVPPLQLKRIARSDEHEVVREVHELYMDIFCMNRDLFSLNIPSISSLTQDTALWSAYEESVFARVVDGLFSACVLSGIGQPLVRYQCNSVVCRKLAFQIDGQLKGFCQLKDGKNMNASQSGDGVLLIVDRRADPVTPLLNQWTYRAMVHELLGIDKNRVDLSKAPDVDEQQADLVLDPSTDSFYEKHIDANFGDMVAAVNEYIKKYQEHSKNSKNISTIQDMQMFVDQFESYRQMSTNVSKHVSLVHELSRIIDINSLLDVSSLEQELVTSVDNRIEHLKQVVERLNNPKVPNKEKLRLVLLYALRYDPDAYIAQLTAQLVRLGVPAEHIGLIDSILTYTGGGLKSNNIFQTRSMLGLAKDVIQRNFKGVENVYTQHKPQLANTVEQLVKGVLKDGNYPAVGNSRDNNYSVTASGMTVKTVTERKQSNVVVFVMGGATYEESMFVKGIANTYATTILFGGSTIHNSNSFLADVAQLTKSRTNRSSTDSVALGLDSISGQFGVFSDSYK